MKLYDVRVDYNGYEENGPEGRGKRKQHCTYCKNHGKKSRKTNHKCDYETCECLLCKLTRLSRLIMRHQQRLWRHLKDSKRREDAAEGIVGTGAGGGGANGRISSTASDPTVAGNGSSKQQVCVDKIKFHLQFTFV
ncbi:hypothetical protein SK128_000350 [Halocaridina rubra]|uniref:DM domain-containing protein n=1 Tax=Halocaridina rubra TaxID=373956 RepID=A0AAN9AHQ7_HALRR